MRCVRVGVARCVQRPARRVQRRRRCRRARPPARPAKPMQDGDEFGHRRSSPRATRTAPPIVAPDEQRAAPADASAGGLAVRRDARGAAGQQVRDAASRRPATQHAGDRAVQVAAARGLLRREPAQAQSTKSRLADDVAQGDTEVVAISIATYFRNIRSMRCVTRNPPATLIAAMSTAIGAERADGP